ncbi:MAG TPA: TolC family protein [Phycisphaerae bacterium]|nr:TolC family protein [Phycisphaerae bacterium]
MQHSTRPPRSCSRRLANSLLLAAVASSTLLAGCNSAIDHESADRGSARYSDSLVARAILQGTYGADAAQTFTVAQGVREYPRVDSPGPTTSDNAVVPATTTAPANLTNTTLPPTTQAVELNPNGTTAFNDISSQPYGSASTQANQVGLAAVTLNAPENLFKLSLQDAIARSLKNTLDIKVQAYNPAISESKVIQQEAFFDPTFFANSNWTNNDEPGATVIDNPANTANHTLPQVFRVGPGFNNGQTWVNDAGIRKVLPTGANVSVSSGFTFRDLTTGAGTGYPNGQSIAANIAANITQPLLRGFGTDVNESQIYLAQRDQRISLEQFRAQVINTVDTVEEDYHNLILARTTVDIEEQLLAATEETERRVSDRISVDADQISISQAQAAVEQRRAELVRGRIDLRNASDKLKQDLNDPEIDIRNNALIDPSDRPIAEPVVFNVADSIETALRQRPELQEDRLKLEQFDIQIKVARNTLLPQLDLTASVQTNGLSNEFDAAFAATVSPGHYLDYGAGISLQIPLGNRQAEALLRQHQLEREQQMTTTVDDAQKIVRDVKNQLRELLGSYQEVQQRERARILAAKELQAITRKEEIVALTPEFLQLKLDSQARLAAAAQANIQAIINYNIALVRLERAKGTLLEFDRISLNRAPIYHPQDDWNKIRFMGKTYDVTK